MKWFSLGLLILLLGCAQSEQIPALATHYPDGVYRGAYYDYSTEQLAVEFEMKDQKFEAIRFIGMRYRDGDYLRDDATQAQQAIVVQYQAATDYLLQKGIASLTDLYKKPEIIPDVDAVTGATLKSSAVVSAICDGLSRMPYEWQDAGTFVFETPVCNGSYRGFFYEKGIERVAVSFELKDEVFVGLQLCSLKDEHGEEYREISKAFRTARRCLEYLENKPLSALSELDTVVEQMAYGDKQLAARLRCAIFGGLSRAPYQSDDAARFFEQFLVEDGTYRGHYYDEGVEQLSVQFEVENGRMHNISLRGNQDNLTDNVQIEQYKLACSLLEGETIAAVNTLYSKRSGSFEAGKLTYAIADALTRGLYKLSNDSLLPAVQTSADGVWSGHYQSEQLMIEVELSLEQDRIISAELTGLKVDAVEMGEEEQVEQLLSQQLKTLTGRPIGQINRLYSWQHPLALPLISALWDAVKVQ